MWVNKQKNWCYCLYYGEKLFQYQRYNWNLELTQPVLDRETTRSSARRAGVLHTTTTAPTTHVIKISFGGGEKSAFFALTFTINARFCSWGQCGGTPHPRCPSHLLWEKYSRMSDVLIMTASHLLPPPKATLRNGKRGELWKHYTVLCNKRSSPPIPNYKIHRRLYNLNSLYVIKRHKAS